MDTEIIAHLEAQFSKPLKAGAERHIVFWYDEQKEYNDEILNLEMKEVEVLIVTENNYFKTKYILEFQKRRSHFLLYFPFKQPKDINNPLLDILLFSEVFQINIVEEFLLELEIIDKNVLTKYPHFFQNKRRRDTFKRLYSPSASIDKAILASLVTKKRSEFHDILLTIFFDPMKIEDIRKFGSITYFWEEIEHFFGYTSNQQTLTELQERLVFTNIANELDYKVASYPYLTVPMNVQIFMNMWIKEDSYQSVTEMIAIKYDLEKQFESIDLEKLVHASTLVLFDEMIIKQIAVKLASETAEFQLLESYIKKRMSLSSFPQFVSKYLVLKEAIQILQCPIDFPYKQEDIWYEYRTNYYKIDQSYRHFCCEFSKLMNVDEAMEDLRAYVEDFYQTNFLTILTEKWTSSIAKAKSFQIDSEKRQIDFYEEKISGFVNKEQRVFIIISDALRFEVAKELEIQFRKDSKYELQMTDMAGVVPSYTDLGMAALLPHTNISLNEKGKVLIDGKSTQGKKAREKVLKENSTEKAHVFTSKEIQNLTRVELRSISSGKKLFYIFQDGIDATGDHKANEHRVFHAVNETLQELSQIVRKLVSHLSATNILITSDHGFLYTDKKIRKQDKLNMPEMKQIVRGKRFIINQQTESNLLAFPSTGLTSNLWTVHTPRGLQRFEIKGVSGNYVHGGCSLQEMFLPLLEIKVNKSASEMEHVDVVLISQTRSITNYQMSLTFLQTTEVSIEKQNSQVEIVFVDDFNKEISNKVKIIADSKEKTLENRLTKIDFVFLNKLYKPHEKCYLNMELNGNLTRESFTIDLFYSEE